jgi:hypothetical protein
MRSPGYSCLSGVGYPRPYASTQRGGVPRVLWGRGSYVQKGGASYSLHKKLMVPPQLYYHSRMFSPGLASMSVYPRWNQGHATFVEGYTGIG